MRSFEWAPIQMTGIPISRQTLTRKRTPREDTRSEDGHVTARTGAWTRLPKAKPTWGCPPQEAKRGLPPEPPEHVALPTP